jgi:HEAT repeat protein
MMFKKIIIVTISVMIAGMPQVSQAADLFGFKGFSNPKAREYKIKRLVSQLYDKQTVVDAQRNLTSYGNEVTPYLLPVLEEKDNETAKVAALNVMANIGDASAEDAVVKLLRDRDDRVRQQAARTLSAMGVKNEYAIEALKEQLVDYNPDVRYNAIRALSKIAPKEDANLFMEALGDYDPRIRMFAVLALGRLDVREAVPYLSQMVRDPDPNVRMAVVIALSKIGTQDCLEPLVVMMRDPDLNVRMLVVEKIGHATMKGADEPLVRVSDSRDPRVASMAIVALGNRKSPLALETARKHIDDEHLAVKLTSIEVIGKMGNKDDLPLLRSLIQAESSQVRKKAKEALAEVKSRT